MIGIDDSDERISEIESQLADLVGPARTPYLQALGQAAMMKYWRVGTGSALARPHLEKAIRALTESRGLMRPEDAGQAMTAMLLGQAYASRGMLHDGPTEDSDRAIDLLEEAMASTALNPPQADAARVIAAQLYLRRSMRFLEKPSEVMSTMRTGAPAQCVSDLDLCAAYLREVVAHDRAREMTEGARAMLPLVEGFRELFGGFGALGPAGYDMNRLMDLMGRLQDTLRRTKEAAELTTRIMPAAAEHSLFDTEWTTRVPPTERPVMVVRTPESEHGAASPERTRPASERPAWAADVAGMRRELASLLPAPGDPLGCMSALIADPDGESPPWLDRYLALAASVVDEARPPTVADHLMLSMGLLLRGRRDEDGWADEGSADENGDARAALDCFLAAARSAEIDPDTDLPVLLGLSALLPAQAVAALGDRLGPLTEDLRRLGYDALVFPEPANTMRWDARTERFESARDLTGVTAVIMLGERPAAAEGPGAVSHLASFAQLEVLAGREIRAVTEDPVFLANPRGDREWAAVEAMLLRRGFFPRSTGLGRLIEDCDGSGTPPEVRTRLATASLLYLDCGVGADGALELADGATLDPADLEVRPGGLAILPPGSFTPLADLLIGVGFAGVVGWRREPSEDAAAVLRYVLHWHLVEQGHTPAQAVGRTRRWAADPSTEILPPMLATRAERLGPVPAADLDALVYRGR